ncbi:hypothetical protein [Cyanobium gracile]|nr:hypothetical protein [Cyanobium gracile]
MGGLPTLLGCALVCNAPAHGAQAGGSTTPTLGEALAPSDSAQMELTEHLRRIGAVFYGAWWCPACFRQKSLFGQQAGDRLPYVECDKTKEGRERCQEAGIKAYPTWVLGSKRVEGVQTIEELKLWSGYAKTPAGGTTP